MRVPTPSFTQSNQLHTHSLFITAIVKTISKELYLSIGINLVIILPPYTRTLDILIHTKRPTYIF